MKFKTLDGIHYDENGECLGSWIQAQRQAKKKGKISDARKKDLDKIGMVWSRIGNKDYIPSSWMKNYELAKNFHDEYKNLRIQQNFKTLDGIHYDENGINLGSWIQTQRQIHNGKIKNKLNQKQIDLLEDIGMNWKGVLNGHVTKHVGKHNISSAWMNFYELAKKYREAHGDLVIIKTFKTNDGIHYDENGKHLGEWIRTQRKARKGTKGSLSQEQIDLLDDIDMIWSIRPRKNQVTQQEQIKPTFTRNRTKKGKNKVLKPNDSLWLDKYELCVNYSKKHGNLRMPKTFMTTDGIKFDKKGIRLGAWLATQRYFYNKGSLPEERKDLLDEIGMEWNIYEKPNKKSIVKPELETIDIGETDEEFYESIQKNPELAECIWVNSYKLAEKFYSFHHHLFVPLGFLTKDGNEYNPNGYDLGTWIEEQRKNKIKGLLSPEKIALLDNLKMNWGKESYRYIFNSEKKMYDIKKITPLNDTDEQELIDSKEKVDFIETKEIVEPVDSKEVAETKEIVEQPKVIDVIEPIKEEVTEPEPTEIFDERLDAACKEFDETIKRIQQEKNQLIDEYRNLLEEKQKLEKRNNELNIELNEVVSGLHNLNKKYILN